MSLEITPGITNILPDDIHGMNLSRHFPKIVPEARTTSTFQSGDDSF
ncbi:MAG: hypothetical protein HYY30_04185 [Chloroflexi bacterium]|nr:hypothetical protein [Chloroflexota bacterium]